MKIFVGWNGLFSYVCVNYGVIRLKKNRNKSF